MAQELPFESTTFDGRPGSPVAAKTAQSAVRCRGPRDVGSLRVDQGQLGEQVQQVRAVEGAQGRPARLVEEEVAVRAAADGDLGPGQMCGRCTEDGVAEERGTQVRQVRRAGVGAVGLQERAGLGDPGPAQFGVQPGHVRRIEGVAVDQLEHSHLVPGGADEQLAPAAAPGRPRSPKSPVMTERYRSRIRRTEMVRSPSASSRLGAAIRSSAMAVAVARSQNADVRPLCRPASWKGPAAEGAASSAPMQETPADCPPE